MLYLVHHGPATDPATDFRQPLSPAGCEVVERLARQAAARGIRPSAIWHSGKLRARQTAEIFWRTCNPLAELCAIRGLQPGDSVDLVIDRVTGEGRDVMMVGHWPHLPQLLPALVGDQAAAFPRHGLVALAPPDDGRRWTEAWRLAEGDAG